MKGNETKLVTLLDGPKSRFIVPIYQRKYSWKIQNCKQLYNDLKKTYVENKSSHFFGSVVASVEADGAITNYLIIDGQQRITTITLLFLSICNLIQSNKVDSNERLVKEIKERFLIDPHVYDEEDNLKLHLIKEDQEVYEKLIDNEKADESSNLTVNYRFFYDSIKEDVNSGVITIEQLYEAIGKLEIICISLDRDDNPQLIFESLNSTGLALSEGDKIRNYVLMNQTSKEQSRLYKEYWSKIEQCTKDNLTFFIRDYLSIKNLIAPKIEQVYYEFKEYVENKAFSIEDVLSDLLTYARVYEQLITPDNTLNNGYKDCLYRLNRLDISVTRPFFMEVLRLKDEEKLTGEDVKDIFLITETYLFRRNICNVASNALNKIFVTLNREIIRYDGTTDDYVEKFKYALLSKRESGRFPDDREFINAFSHKDVYNMRGKFKNYLFERLENCDTKETKDVYQHLNDKVYSIEHIMPQTLSPSWQKDLGEDYETIHDEWLHRLANLTLTAYNPNLSNKSFIEKRDAEQFGYKYSGIRMNQSIAQQDSWGLLQLEARNEDLMKKVKVIWSYPESDYVPPEREFNAITLDDENINLTGKKLIKYRYKNVEKPAQSWVDMFKDVISYLYEEDKTILLNLINSDKERMEWDKVINTDENSLRNPAALSNGLFLETNNNTDLKISILRRLFAVYDIDPSNLTLYLEDEESDEKIEKRKLLVAPIEKWVNENPNIKLGFSTTATIRYTTPYLNNLIGELDEEKSGWGNKDVYYYEIFNRSAMEIHVKLVFSGISLKPSQREVVEKIIHICTPNKELPNDWHWRTVFRSGKYDLNPDMSEEEMFKQLDKSFEEVQKFEEQLKEKLG